MVFQDSRRSVLPNGEHIDMLRKKKGWTIEALALESDLGMRTVQKAIAGGPVSIATLQIIAEQLEAPYASLLLGAEGELSKEEILLAAYQHNQTIYWIALITVRKTPAFWRRSINL